MREIAEKREVVRKNRATLLAIVARRKRAAVLQLGKSELIP
jgi:hypothetical protein